MPAHGGWSEDGQVGSSGRWSRNHQSLGTWSRNLVGRWVSDGQPVGEVGEQRRAASVSGGMKSGKPRETGGLVGEEGEEMEMEREELQLAGQVPRQ